MRIDLLYVPDCANLATARERIGAALGTLGVATTVHETEIDSLDAAVATGMRGSPTILIDGVDPFAPSGTTPSLSCRLVRTDDGIEGVPSVEHLVAAMST